jgi:ABC-type Fe3+/spermidine/putrescine transport system ATPase subunit
LKGLEKRSPSELSGGQQQRVAVARALVLEPQVLLFDEPLSNLDAKLRRRVREDIRELQQNLNLTVAYVTHDQEEALAVSDRICVMNKGNVEQIGTPFEIYRKPLRKFAASFVGTMNFLPGRIESGRLIVGSQSVSYPAHESGTVEVAIRPENVQLVLAGSEGEAIALKGEVQKVTFLGREAHYTLKTDAGVLVAQVADPEHDFIQMEGRPVEVRLPLSKIVLFRSNGDVIDAGQA